jgi:hypothetical protein
MMIEAREDKKPEKTKIENIVRLTGIPEISAVF